MTRTALRSAAAATLAALAAVAAIIAADFTAPASATTLPTCSGYIVAQRLEDGRVQVIWKEREINGWWVVPNQRYIPADAPVDRWLQSSTVRVGGWGAISIDARPRSDGRIEFAYTRIRWNNYRDPNDRERILPELRYFPADAPVGRWVYSSEIRFLCQFHPISWQFRRRP